MSSLTSTTKSRVSRRCTSTTASHRSVAGRGGWFFSSHHGGRLDAQGTLPLGARVRHRRRRRQPFESQSIAWQAATIFFAVLDLVAAVGLWLAAAWGAVIWLMAVASMAAVEMFFPQVFGGGLVVAGRKAQCW